MAGTENLDAAQQHSELQWEMHQDIFAPQLPPRITRAFERAPRSAHAPRLHGHKIWKRPGLQFSSYDNKENEEAVQLELGKGGVGSRKKARVVGAREDIRDAKWVDEDEGKENKGSLEGVNTPKKTRLGLAVRSPDYFGGTKGRKRTNAGGAVSPRKPLGNKPNNRENAIESPLKSCGSPLKVHEKPVKVHGSPTKVHRSPEKPASRRRSMRRSLGRKLTFTPDDSQVNSQSRRESLKQVSVFEVEGMVNGIQEMPSGIDNSSLLHNMEGPAIPHTEVTKVIFEQTSPLNTASLLEERLIECSAAVTASLQDSVDLEGSKEADSDLRLAGKTMLGHEGTSSDDISHKISSSTLAEDAMGLNTNEESNDDIQGCEELHGTFSKMNRSALFSEGIDGPNVEDTSIEETLEPISELTSTNTALSNQAGEEKRSDRHMNSEMPQEPTSMLESFQDEVFEDKDNTMEDVSMIEEPTLQNFEGLSVIEESPEEEVDTKTEEEQLAEQLFATSPMKSEAAPPSPKPFDEESTMRRLELDTPVISTMDQEVTTTDPEPPSKQVAIDTPVKDRRSSQRLSERPSTRRSTRIARLSLSQSKDDATESTPVQSLTKAMSCARASPVKSMRPRLASPQPDSTIQLLFTRELSETALLEEQVPNNLQEPVIESREYPEEIVRFVEVVEPSQPDLPRSKVLDSQSPEGCNMSTDMNEVADEEDTSQTTTTSSNNEPPTSYMMTEGPVSSSANQTEQISAALDESPESSFATEDSTVLELDDDNYQTTTLEIDVDQSMDESLETLEPISIAPANNNFNNEKGAAEDSTQPLIMDSSTLVEEASDDTRVLNFDHDDTNVLQNFLARVNANKAAKARKVTTKRKRSLPHSPIRLPLETEAMAASPEVGAKDEFDVSLPTESPRKRRKRNSKTESEEDITEPETIRRSGRTRLPVKSSLPALNFIPVRRLGSDDTTVTLKKNADKELAALTRNNTRKNKAGAVMPLDVLAKLGEKEDPATRQRALKEVFDEKAHRKKGKKAKTVVWAEQLNHYQGNPEENKEAMEEKKIDPSAILEKKIEAVKAIAKELEEPVENAETMKETEKPKGKPVTSKSVSIAKIATPVKSSIPRVSMKSKIALGMAVNGTPAPKRRMRSRS